jgi:glycosyltransferase involved in cell wall biosynthesis
MGKRRKIIILGLPFFAEKLCKNLQHFDKKNTYIHLNTYYSKWDKIKAFFLIPNASLVYSINGSLTKSKVFDLAIKKNVPLLMQWVGTDVLLAKKAVESKVALSEYINKAHHFAEVSWIKQELDDIGIQASLLNFASFDKKFDAKLPNGNQLAVLNYIADASPGFYGIDNYINLAKKFPDCTFYIAGTKAENYKPLPHNVEALGWVENMDEILNKVHICIRTTEHDGLSTFVLEALARGKHVIYSYPFQHCIFVKDFNAQVLAMEKLVESFKEGQLFPNNEGKLMIENEFNRQTIFTKLTQLFSSNAKQ